MSESNGHISRDDFIKAASEVRTRDVMLPNGKKLRLQSITTEERLEKLDLWLHRNRKTAGEAVGIWKACRALQLCARNPDGTLMFSDDDFEWMRTKAQSGYLEDAAVDAISLLEGESVADEIKN